MFGVLDGVGGPGLVSGVARLPEASFAALGDTGSCRFPLMLEVEYCDNGGETKRPDSRSDCSSFGVVLIGGTISRDRAFDLLAFLNESP